MRPPTRHAVSFFTLTLIIAILSLAISSRGDAKADPLPPGGQSSLGPLPSGSFTIDTDALTYGGIPGGIVRNQPGGPEVAVFTFDDDGVLGVGDTITVVGSRPVAILFQGSAIIRGEIVAAGQAGGDGIEAAGGIGGLGGPGGAPGGDGTLCGSTSASGQGPGAGGGGTADTEHGTFVAVGGGGGGGGFGGGGAPGTAGGDILGGPGGVSYGNLANNLQGGSGAGAGGAACQVFSDGTIVAAPGGGGGGGGGVEIGAETVLTFFDGKVRASGGPGGLGLAALADGNLIATAGGGGGGSGGGIFLHAHDVILDGDTVLDATGGDAGALRGGQGGGGRVLVLTNTNGLIVDGTQPGAIDVSGANVGSVDFLTSSTVGSKPPIRRFLPNDFSSLGPLPAGSFTIDTDSLTVGGSPGGVVGLRFGPPQVAIFAFDGGSVLAAGDTITIVGSRPAAILFQGSVLLRGDVIANGGNGADGSGPAGFGIPGSAGPGGAGGPAGFSGGAGSLCETAGVTGLGPGSGGGGTNGVGAEVLIGLADPSGGGGGAGFAGTGGQGAGNLGGSGGTAYGLALPVLGGGSGGGGGGGVCPPPGFPLPDDIGGGGGGGGGGAVEIGADQRLIVEGTIHANGGAGGAGGTLVSSEAAGGGGGSGGAIFLHGHDVVVGASASIEASGGSGGSGIRSGGNGGGGRVAILTDTGGSLDDRTSGAAFNVSGANAGDLDFLTDVDVGQPSPDFVDFRLSTLTLLSVVPEAMIVGTTSTWSLEAALQNNAGQDFPEVEAGISGSIPSDCAATLPGPTSLFLADSESLQFDVPITCAQDSAHTFEFTASVSALDPTVSNSSPTDDSATLSDTRSVVSSVTVPFAPGDFPSLGSLAAGSFIIDTDALTVGGSPGGTALPQTGGTDVALFTFDGGAHLASDQTITIVGSRPAVLLFQGSAQIHGTIEASGAPGGSGAEDAAGVGGPGGPNGGNGGVGSACTGGNGKIGAGPGHGFGGTGGFTGNRGGAGGGAGHGGAGAEGLSGGPLVPGGLGGSAYGDIGTVLAGGSGGGGGGGAVGFDCAGGGGGGGGGGAIEIGAETSLLVTGTVRTNGGGGGPGFVAPGPVPSLTAVRSGGGGGGSGGGILLHAFNVTLSPSALLQAAGGAGGGGGTNVPTGGAGGGGRIVVITNTNGVLDDSGSFDVNGANPGNVGLLVDPDVGTFADATPPVIAPTVDGSLGNNDWYVSDVTISWDVSDPESPVTSTTGCGTTTVSEDTGPLTFTCTAQSAGGESFVSVTIKRDATPPVVTGSRTPGPNANGWNNSDVTVNFTCEDVTSGVATCPVDTTLKDEGANQSVEGTAVDLAGNSAAATVTDINIDKTAPAVTGSPSRPADHNGWYNRPFSLAWQGEDNLSGVASCSPDTVYDGPDTGEGSLLGSCTDLADNEGDGAFDFQYDATPPEITGTRTPGPNQHGWNNTDVTVSYTATDNLSGIDGAASDLANDVLTEEGANQSASGTAVDLAGNSATATVTDINIDKTPPVASAVLSPDTLWPPNHKMVDVIATVEATDNLSGVDSKLLTSLTSDEPDNGLGDGDTADDIQGADIGTEDFAFHLRAERQGTGDGRTYTAVYSVADLAENSTETVGAAIVPHDRRPNHGRPPGRGK